MAVSDIEKQDYRKRLSSALGDFATSLEKFSEQQFSTPTGEEGDQVMEGQVDEGDSGLNLPDNFGEQVARSGLSANQFESLLESSSVATPQERQVIRDRLGVDDAMVDAFYVPEQQTQQLFDEAYDNSDLAEIKARMNNVDQQINKTRKDLAESIETIDENPFLSEDTRVGEGRRRLEQAETKIGNLQSRYKSLAERYNMGLGEIEGMVGRMDSDVARRNSTGMRKLNYLTELANQRADELQAERFSEGIQEETVPYLSELEAREAPKTIGTSTTGYYQWDPELKKYVQVVPPGGDGGGGEGDTDTPETPQNVGDFEAYVEEMAVNPTGEAKTLIDKEQERLKQTLGVESRKALLRNSSAVRSEFDEQNTQQRSLSEDDLTPSNRRDLNLAGLLSAPADTQKYFLASDNDFQDWMVRAISSGQVQLPGDLTVQELQAIEQEFKKAVAEEEGSTAGTSKRTP